MQFEINQLIGSSCCNHPERPQSAHSDEIRSHVGCQGQTGCGSRDPRPTPLTRRERSRLTTTEQVGRIAAEAGVETLVLSHFVHGGYPFLKDEVWFEAVRPYFSGNLVVGHDLLEL
jgi:hypothetical protein